MRVTFLSLAILVGVFCFQSINCAAQNTGASKLKVGYQTRDSSDRIMMKERVINPAKVGIVIIDMWNFHWCKTSAGRVAAMVPRMNKCLDVARTLGMQVFFCPTDVANNYVGYPQRERAIAAPFTALPPSLNIVCPHPGAGGCMCGKDQCISNGGWNGMAEEIAIKDRDIISSGPQELYNLCKQLGLTELWYMGVHTNNCVLGKPEGMRNMMNYGFQCVLVRDLQDPETFYDPKAGRTPDGNNALVVKHFERYLAPSVNMGEMLGKNGLWNEKWLVDPVRITPWGKVERPHQFKDSVIVTLSAPLNRDVKIRYTLDGSAPGPSSPIYSAPFTLSKSTVVRANSFKDGKTTGLESKGKFVLLPPAAPVPDVRITDLSPMQTQSNARKPRQNESFQQTPLAIHGIKYENGVAMHAPSFMVYQLKPEYDRFTAQCGIDDFTGTNNWGRELAKFPSVVFKVFIDGQLAAESPGHLKYLHSSWLEQDQSFPVLSAKTQPTYWEKLLQV